MPLYLKRTDVTDLREAGRVILAHGEATGHAHEVVETRPSSVADGDLPASDYFEEPVTGRRVLLVIRSCELVHPDHSLTSRTILHASGRVEKVTLTDGVEVVETHEYPAPVRQGDVYLQPIGLGAWAVIRQREYDPTEVRLVSD